MQKLKIALVSPYPPSKGTLNEYAYHLVEQFKEKSEIREITLITDRLPEGEAYRIEAGSVPVYVKAVWSFNAIMNIFHILRAVIRSKADVVLFNIHFLSFGDRKVPAALGLMIPMLCRFLGFPSVVLLHNIVESVDLDAAGITKNKLLSRIFQWFGTLLTHFLLASNQLTVTISKYVEILEAKYRTSKVALVPHGSFELPAMPDFNQAGAPKKVMSFGKFGTYKKVGKMIEAVELVRQETGASIEIVIAGTDSPNSKGYLKSMQEQYAHVPDITFTGYVAEEDVPTVFRESTVVVFPYTSTTGSSGVLHQAGSYGKACILPNIGDLKILIEEEGYTGAYFEPDSSESMARAIRELLTDDQRRTAIARQNYAAAASLPMSDIADWYLLHFEHVLSKAKSRWSKFSFLRSPKGSARLYPSLK